MSSSDGSKEIAPLLSRVFPVVGVIPTLSRADLCSDVIAGLTVGVMIVPQAMAYAALAALRAEHGLYSCVFPVIVYALLGTSRSVSVGPSTMVSLLASAGLSNLAHPVEEQQEYVALVSLLSFAVGLIMVAMGVLRLDCVARFVSQPVLSGFTSAAAVVTALSQLDNLVGIQVQRETRVHRLIQHFVMEVDHAHVPTIAISLASIVFLFAATKVKRAVQVLKRFPDALFLVIALILASERANFRDSGVAIVGEVPRGLPLPSTLPWGRMADVLPTAVSVALLAFLQSFAVAKAISEKDGSVVNPRRELIALGLCNVAGAFFKCMPVAGSLSRSAVNYQAGAKSTLSSIVTALAVLMVVLYLTPVFATLPQSVLAAIIVVSVISMVDTQRVKKLWKIDQSDLLMLVISFSCTLFVGLVEGILIASAMSLLLVLQKAVIPRGALLGQVRDDPPVYNNIGCVPEAFPVEGVLIYRFDGPLFFANADLWQERMHRLIRRNPDTVCVVLHGGGVAYLDSTGGNAIDAFMKECKSLNRAVFFAELNQPCRDTLERMGVTRVKGDELEPPFFWTIHDAVQSAKVVVQDANISIDSSMSSQEV
mmetsp:Transcript_24649/g.52555  ORF Transcript_24649/g.52555 Transcript_24649/m.52555 type:complete len:595 (-) Transcript_24649:572-2356(-)